MILVMEKLAEKAQFRIYRNGRSFRTRPLAENEDFYRLVNDIEVDKVEE